MDEFRTQLEMIYMQLESGNKDFILNLQSALSSIHLPGQSPKLQNHLQLLSNMCTQEPARAINIIKKYISILDSPALVTTQIIPVDLSKTISITNCLDSSTHTSRILPGTEINFSFQLTTIKIEIKENFAPSTNQTQKLSIYIKENPACISKTAIDANDRKIDEGQFYFIISSLLHIEHVSEDEIRAKLYPNIIMNSIEQVCFSEQGYIEYLINKSNYNFTYKNDRLEKLHFFTPDCILFMKPKTNWIFKSKSIKCFLYLGNPLKVSSFTQCLELDPTCPQFFINSTPYIISMSN